MLKELETSYKNLLKVLKEEELKHEILMDLLLLQRRCIMDRDIDTFEKILESQQELISDIIFLENQRDSIIKPFGIALGKHPKEITLSDIVFFLKDKEKEELQRTMLNLNKLLEEIEKIRSGNEYLIKHSIMFIQKVLDFAFDSPPIYKFNGNMQNNNSKSLFVKKNL